jgi:predicted HTH domain antitoxin
MNTQTISIDIPSDILIALNESESKLKNEIKILLAIRFYQQEKLTIGKAAQLCGLSRIEFESLLSENQISISNLTLDDIISDSKKLK